MTGKKVTKNSKTMAGPQENNCSPAMKTQIKELGPICKSRKKYERDSPKSKQEEDDDDDEGFVWLFSKASQSQQESLWLSSESLSPIYKGGDFRFMSPRDYSIDERMISLLSSYGGINSFEGSLTLKEMLPEDETWLSKSCLDCSSESSSSFWDLDRTDLWVSLINLDGEDCKWISNVDSDSENLESDFPSPTYENKSKGSVHDELSSELLSGSLDLDDLDFDEPLMWPFDDKYNWSDTSDFFCQSPRRGIGSSVALSRNDGRRIGQPKEWRSRRFVAASGSSASKIIGFKNGNRRIIIASRSTKLNRSSRKSMKMMLSASKLGKKHKFGKGNLVMSAKRLQAMSLVGIDEFHWCDSSDEHSHKYSASSHEGSSDSSSMDFDSSGLWVSLINLNEEDSDVETDWEEGLNWKSNFPSPSYKNRRNEFFCSSEVDVSFDNELSIEILTDQIDADEPLFWPYAEDQKWSKAWDSFCESPRKGTFRRDGQNIFGSSTSIRVRIHDQRVAFNRSVFAVSGLSASKIVGFKRGYGKKGNARRAKGMNPRFGRSVGRKFSKSVAGKMDAILETDIEGIAVETILGLDEFDGHEGLDMEFQTKSFSILED